jgi:hypothetical protein
MFNYKSKIRKRAACRAEAARSVSVLESVDVDGRSEHVRDVREARVDGIDVVFKRDEFVGVVIEASRAEEVFDVFGRDIEKHI